MTAKSEKYLLGQCSISNLLTEEKWKPISGANENHCEMGSCEQPRFVITLDLH